MPRQEHILTVFVASPSDVAAERNRLEEVIAELNQTWSRSLEIRLELIRWETHAYPGFSEDPQAVINRQIPGDYDIFIGIMWHRFGTPSNRADSGTHEEFLRAKARWDEDKESVTLMVYFKDAPVSPSQIDVVQLGKVAEFRKSLGNEGGLYWSFQSTDEFVNFTRIHLTRAVQEWQNKLPVGGKGQPAAKAMPNLSSVVQTGISDDDEVGLFELREQFEDSFIEANNVLTRIAKSTDAIGKKMQEHTIRMQTAKVAGQVTPIAAKRMIGKVAKDMNDYARKLDQDVPCLGGLMNTGLGALSQAISMWPDISRNQDQKDEMEGMVIAIQGLRNVLPIVKTQIMDFRNTVKSLPRLTSDLNKAKRSVSSALQNVIDLLQTQLQILSQTEKSATDLIKSQGGIGEEVAVDAIHEN